MSIQQKTREVILKLKAVKEERGLSLQRILDMVLENGGNISMSSVRKVFSEGSENLTFRYEDTIKPIADVLLAVPENIPAVYEPDETEAEALRSIIRLKNSIITEMQDEIDRAAEKIADSKAENQRKIEFLKSEIDKRDALLAERRDFIYSKDSAIRGRNWLIFFLSMALLLCIGVIIAALVVDKLNPGVGFFWLDDMAAKVFSGKGLANIPSGSLFSF